MYVIRKDEVGYRIHGRGSKKSKFAIHEAYQYTIVIPRLFRQIKNFVERNGYELIISMDDLPLGFSSPFSLLTKEGFGKVVVHNNIIIKVDDELIIVSEEDFQRDWLTIPKNYEDYINKIREENKK